MSQIPSLPPGIDRLPRGICWTPKGWRATVRHEQKRFPPSTLLGDVVAWREDEKARQRLGIQDTQERQARPRTFDNEIADYLLGCVAMPSYDDRVRDIGYWANAIVRINGRDVRLGDEPSRVITPQVVRTICARWKTQGPRAQQYFDIDLATDRKVQKFRLVPGPLSASTVNLRKRALQNFFTVKNGRTGDNSVREVEDYETDEGEIKSLPIEVLRQIVEALHDTGKSRGPRAKTGRFAVSAETGESMSNTATSKTKARIRVMVETGLPHQQLKLIKSEHVHYDTSSVWVSRRKKGKGIAAHEMPLSPAAVEAFRALAVADGFGTFSNSSLAKAWHQACRIVEQQYAAQDIEIDLSKKTPYSARHSFATDVVREMKDTHLASKLLLHGNRKTTERYGRAAIDPILIAAVQRVGIRRDQQALVNALPRLKVVKMGLSVQEPPTQLPTTKLATKLATTRNR